MASIRIKTDSLDIKINDVSPDEFNGAWKWIVDIVGQFYDIETGSGSDEKQDDKEDNRPYSINELIYYLNAYQIKNTACSVIDDLYANMVKKDYLKDLQHYDVDLLGKIPFEVICDRLLDNRQLYPPEEAAKLTGKICARFFYEQSKKGTPIR